MRGKRWAWLAMIAVTGTVALAGCGGHSGGSPGAAAHGSTPTTPPAPPIKVVSIAPLKRLKPMGTITVNFASPLASNSPLPTVHPAVPGTWARSAGSAVFTPSQAYPPDTTVTVKFKKKLDGKNKVIATRATPHGSLRRVQQILAHLHYVPLTTSAVTPTTAADEADAVYSPPAGGFTWRYADTPATLKRDWAPGQSGEVLRGAIIKFQHDAQLAVDGNVGKDTWQALNAADLADTVDPAKYSFVSADLNLPQRLSVWVDGHTVLTSPVNGGINGAPTPLGTFPVYERLTSTTMSGTNPSGSHYSDPGVPWVNYFSGGSAVHGFPRASYGTPQSVGCLELPIPTAKTVFGLIDYGTLVNVQGPYVPSSSAAPSDPTPTASSTPKATPTASATPSHKAKH